MRCYKPPEYYETWRGKKEFAGGGVLLSQSIHNIDQLIYMLGFNPVEVSCKTKITREGNDVEDEAKGIIYFDNGMQVEINTTANSEEDWECITEITGEDARIRIDSSKTLLWEIPLGFPELEESEDIPEDIKPNYYGPGHKKIVDDFVSSIVNNRDPKFVVEDALLTMKIIFGMYKSAENDGQIVRLDDM